MELSQHFCIALKMNAYCENNKKSETFMDTLYFTLRLSFSMIKLNS